MVKPITTGFTTSRPKSCAAGCVARFLEAARSSPPLITRVPYVKTYGAGPVERKTKAVRSPCAKSRTVSL